MDQHKNLAPHFNSVHGNSDSAFSLERAKISESIFKELIPVMNEIHDANYSYRFWKIVINDYVNAVITIKALMEQNEMQGSPSLEAVNSHHVLSLKEKIIARLPFVIKHFKTISNRNRIAKILAGESNVSVSLPDIEMVRKETGHPLPLYYPLYPGKGDLKKREKANAIAKRYTDIYHKNIIQKLPQVYVEYFDMDFKSINLSNPREKTFHVHGLPPYFNALVIAKYTEFGARLNVYQHGAYYGELTGHNAYLYENSLADEYRTWGWKIRPNDVPWKAYRLEKFKLRYDTFPQTKQFDFLMCFPDVNNATAPFYKTGTEYFLQNIDPAKYKNLLARPRPMNKIFSHASRISFIKDSRVTIDSGLADMAEVIGKCKIVIQFTIPATNFLECLYVDHPTMGLLDNDQPTEIIKPYYDFLMQQGILHKDFISLVNHLNKINVEEWWGALIKEPMYLQFKNEFLRKVQTDFSVAFI